MEVIGDVTIRAGSQDYIEWQLLQEDGITPISLVSATSVTLRFKHKVSDAVTEFKTTDNPQKLFIKDAADVEIQLRPAVADFTVVGSYKFHTIVVDGIGNHPIPEGENYTLQVIDSYPSS